MPWDAWVWILRDLICQQQELFFQSDPNHHPPNRKIRKVWMNKCYCKWYLSFLLTDSPSFWKWSVSCIACHLQVCRVMNFVKLLRSASSQMILFALIWAYLNNTRCGCWLQDHIMMGRDPPPSSTIALWSTRYLPNHLDQFGPKDVVGAATALGRLKELEFLKGSCMM